MTDSHELGPIYFERYQYLRSQGKIGRIWPEGNLYRAGPVNEMERVLGPSTYAMADSVTVEKLKGIIDKLDDRPRAIPAGRERGRQWMNVYLKKA